MQYLAALILLTLITLSCEKASPPSLPVPPPDVPIEEPTPTPTATPIPTATPWACVLPKQPDCSKQNPNCCKPSNANQYSAKIATAQHKLLDDRPELFKPDGSLKVSEIEYTAALARTFELMFEICASGGGVEPISPDEISIKASNSENINVDVIRGTDNKPWVGGTYTCQPAAW